MSIDNTPKKPEERESMFVYWCECQNKSETAEAFKTSRTTVLRIATQDEWDTRYETLTNRLRKKLDTKISNRILKNIEFIRDMKTRLLESFLNKPIEGINASIRDIIALMEYEDKLVARENGERLPEERDININVTLHDKILSMVEMKNDKDGITGTKETVQ